MKILSIVEKKLNPKEQAYYFLSAVEKLGMAAVNLIAEWDDPMEEVFINTLFRIEKNGPEKEPVHDCIKENTDAEIILTSFCPISAESIDFLETARIIGSIRGGVQHINVEAATKKGIAVFNTPGRNAHAVSDFTIGLMICECRNIARNHCMMINKNWMGADKIDRYMPDLDEKILGLVGLGHVGRLVAKKVSGFNMKVIAFDPFINKSDLVGTGIELVDLDTLCEKADFISLHAKATDDNRHMINKKHFDLMKRNVFFINTARSALVDTKALIDALKNKSICGAALDVYDKEPLPPDSPLLDLENVTLTGHLAGVSSDVVSGSPRLLVSEIVDLIKGDGKRGLINPEVLENPDFKSWLKKIAENF